MAKQKTEQDFNIRHRLVGAFVLLASGIIFIPMILQGHGPGVGKSDNLTEEVQEWIVGTEEAETYISRVVPVGEGAGQEQIQPVVIDENATPELQVIEETVSAIEQSVEAQTQDQIKTIKEVAAIESMPEPVQEAVEQPKVVETKQVAGIKAENVSRGWVVQVGTFSKPENAQNLITKLNQNGFDSRYEVIDTDAGQATRVWVGPYEKRVTAARALELVKENTGVKGFLKSYP